MNDNAPMGYVRISKLPGRLPPEWFHPVDINIRFEIHNRGMSESFSFPIISQSWFWVSYQTIVKREGDEWLFHLNLVDGNLVFSSVWEYETVQGGVILSIDSSGNEYKIDFGFVSD